MTKEQLINDVARTTGITQKKAREVLGVAFMLIFRAVRADHRFNFPRFGVWSIRYTKSRRIRNPQTNGIMTLPRMKRIGFRLAKELRALL